MRAMLASVDEDGGGEGEGGVAAFVEASVGCVE